MDAQPSSTVAVWAGIILVATGCGKPPANVAPRVAEPPLQPPIRELLGWDHRLDSTPSPPIISEDGEIVVLVETAADTSEFVRSVVRAIETRSGTELWVRTFDRDHVGRPAMRAESPRDGILLPARRPDALRMGDSPWFVMLLDAGTGATLRECHIDDFMEFRDEVMLVGPTATGFFALSNRGRVCRHEWEPCDGRCVDLLVADDAGGYVVAPSLPPGLPSTESARSYLALLALEVLGHHANDPPMWTSPIAAEPTCAVQKVGVRAVEFPSALGPAAGRPLATPEALSVVGSAGRCGGPYAGVTRRGTLWVDLGEGWRPLTPTE